MTKIRGSLFAIVASCCFIQFSAASAADLRIFGSGASFPSPLYAAWFKEFNRITQGVIVDYQAKGSGAAIQDLKNNLVDFAATEAMTPDRMSELANGYIFLPMTAGEVVVAYNLPGQKEELRLPRDVYADIFAGKITRWNDPRVAAANSQNLPDLPITVVRRSDSSGTTYLLTKHLSAIDKNFSEQVGAGTTVNWPRSDKFIAAPKNDGVAASIKQIPGAIGYIEFSYAKLTNSDTALLENHAGNYVAAGADTGKAALSDAHIPADLVPWITDPLGPDAYPIVGFSWIIVRENQGSQKAKILRELIRFGLTDGQKDATSMGYIPLPDNVVRKAIAASARLQ
jgi:phosphate transport system substrate-binding protein